MGIMARPPRCKVSLMRQPLVIANWKMHGERSSNRELLTALKAQFEQSGGEVVNKTCVICPPYPYLGQVAELLQESSLQWGGQDCSHCVSGAYTGEVSVSMLADFGCRWVVIGHSERRQYHRESDALIAAKLVVAQKAGLMPVLCVGETLEQREAGEAEQVAAAQLRGALADLANLTEVVIAYEPVWAIGTGQTATPEQAQEMHGQIRALLRELDAGNAESVRLLYGGSVKADNAAALFAMDDIDGALVGGASLDATAFATIVAAA